MSNRPTGPACGNNPNHPLTEGDRQAVADFKTYLAARATPSRRAGLHDEIVKALGLINTTPPVAHRREQADHVLAVLYREWPWLRAEAEDAGPTDGAAVLSEAEAEAERQLAAVQRVRHVLETEPVLNRTALEYRGLIVPALMADEVQPGTGSQPQPCVHCGKAVLRVSGTLAVWWVHDPGGHTICFPQQAASSPRATPQHADEARQDATATDKPAPGSTEPRPCRTFVSGGTVWCCEEGETDCPCVCHQPAAEARQDGATS